MQRVNDLVRFALTAFFPRTDDLPGLADLGVDERIANFRRESTWLFWMGIVVAAICFELTPMLTLKRLSLATSLTSEELDQHAHVLASHPFYLLRQAPMMLKLIGGMFWAESPEIRSFVNLPPYQPDPGTRRTEAFVPRMVPPPHEVSSSKLVELGRQERARGRDGTVNKGLRA